MTCCDHGATTRVRAGVSRWCAGGMTTPPKRDGRVATRPYAGCPPDAVPSATPTQVVKFEECGFAVQRIPTATPSEISELARCCTVFVPGDPARSGRVAFWRPDGSARPPLAAGSAHNLAVALPGGDGAELVEVPAVLLPMRAALPVLTRARTDAHAHRGAAFWGSAAVLALQLLARGLLLPGLSPGDHDAWRVGPLPPEDVDRIREPTAAMPPEAHAPMGPRRPPGGAPRPTGPQDHTHRSARSRADGLGGGRGSPGRRTSHGVAGGPAGAARGPGVAGAGRAARRSRGHLAGLPAPGPELAGPDDVPGPGLLSGRRHRTSPNSPRRTTGSRRPPVSAFGMQASPAPDCDATTNLSRGLTAFPVQVHRHSRETTECMTRSAFSRKDIDATSKSRLTFRELWPYGAARIEGVPCCQT